MVYAISSFHLSIELSLSRTNNEINFYASLNPTGNWFRYLHKHYFIQFWLFTYLHLKGSALQCYSGTGSFNTKVVECSGSCRKTISMFVFLLERGLISAWTRSHHFSVENPEVVSYACGSTSGSDRCLHTSGVTICDCSTDLCNEQARIGSSFTFLVLMGFVLHCIR